MQTYHPGPRAAFTHTQGTAQGGGAGCKRLAYTSQVETKRWSKPAPRLPACNFAVVRSSYAQRWAWSWQCWAPGCPGGHEPWQDGAWRHGWWCPAPSATLHVSWSRGSTEPPKRVPGSCSPGRCQQWLQRCVSHRKALVLQTPTWKAKGSTPQRTPVIGFNKTTDSPAYTHKILVMEKMCSSVTKFNNLYLARPLDSLLLCSSVMSAQDEIQLVVQKQMEEWNRALLPSSEKGNVFSRSYKSFLCGSQ